MIYVNQENCDNTDAEAAAGDRDVIDNLTVSVQCLLSLYSAMNV